MAEEMRKRLEEAAGKYQEEYETTERVAFTHGDVWGYKEAIAQVKEWMKKNTFTNKLFGLRPIQYWDFATQEQMLTNFESDMNELFEETESDNSDREE